MKRILVPTNFSTQAGWAIEVAAYLIRKSNAELVLLHVVEHPATESFDAEPELNVLEDDAQHATLRKLMRRNRMYLNELASNLSAIGISVVKVIRQGNLLHAIKTVVFDYNIDLVVMGTTKRSKIEEVLDRSRTEQVVKFSQAPVLAVHEKPWRNQFRNIVYATSLSEDGAALPEILTSAKKLYGARVHIATVNTPKISREANELEKEMEGFARKYKLENYSINVLNDNSEEVGIVRFAESIGADLIVIAAHGRERLTHEIKGNIPQDLVNHSSIPVLTYLA